MMKTSKTVLAMMFGFAVAGFAGGAMAQGVNGHRPSDHSLDFPNHPYEALYSGDTVRQGTAARGFSTISPRDRALQRVDDIKRRTTESGYVANAGPVGLQPFMSVRDRELLRLGAEKDRMTGG